ncbi:MAG TPA: DOMON-like domain-containing protein [Bdellovibrionales bacterium]|nr:DOMON-like domain-containing protein [Bdellovibrionales bacterium]
MLASHALTPWKEGANPLHQFNVQLHRIRDVLHFSFEMSGSLNCLAVKSLKPKAERMRADELWKTTCMEIFVGPRGHHEYIEFNLSPSGDWNAYTFDSYRKGMRPTDDAMIDLETVELTADRFRMRGRLQSRREGELSDLLRLPHLEASATAVIETAANEIQYWAVKHAGEKPDFHLRSSFSIELE